MNWFNRTFRLGWGCLASRPFFQWFWNVFRLFAPDIQTLIVYCEEMKLCIARLFICAINLILVLKFLGISLFLSSIMSMIVSIYLFGWVAGSLQAHFRNYRHFMTSVPSAPWTDYPIPLTKHGLTRAKVCSVAKWTAVSGNRTLVSCTGIKDDDHDGAIRVATTPVNL